MRLDDALMMFVKKYNDDLAVHNQNTAIQDKKIAKLQRDLDTLTEAIRLQEKLTDLKIAAALYEDRKQHR